jgi:hypothetical protein
MGLNQMFMEDKREVYLYSTSYEKDSVLCQVTNFPIRNSPALHRPGKNVNESCLRADPSPAFFQLRHRTSPYAFWSCDQPLFPLR